MEDQKTTKQSILTEVVNSLCDSEHGMLSWKAKGGRLLPSRDQVVEVTEALRSVLFPGYFGVSELTEENMRFHVGATLDRIVFVLQDREHREQIAQAGRQFVVQKYSWAHAVERVGAIEEQLRRRVPGFPSGRNVL